MRIYKNFPEALSEITRDVKEMGIEVHTRTYQNVDISDIEEMATYELQNYVYTVTEPLAEHLDPMQPWADLEFEERVSEECINPGEAWKHRSELWTQFLNERGEFDYSYPERIGTQVRQVIKTLKRDANSRQAFLCIWDKRIDPSRTARRRVPCSLGYHFQIRNGKLNITYLQRSADLFEHFVNDIYLAHRMQLYVADKAGVDVGYYCHWLGSLHVFKRDVQHVF